MSKKLILALTAVLGMVACTQERLEVADSPQDNGGVKFRIAVNRPTTKGEIFFNSNPSDLAPSGSSTPFTVRAVASYVSTSGETINNDFFVVTSGSTGSAVGEPTLGYLAERAADDWVVSWDKGTSISPIPFPFGADTRMNTLFLAAPEDGDYSASLGKPDYSNAMRYWGDGNDSDYQSAAAGGWGDVDDANWHPVFSDDQDFTKKAEFLNVDTQVHQMDLMYASSNNIKAGETKNVIFDHAQAVVIFNLNISNKSKWTGATQSSAKAALLFVKPDAELNSDTSKTLKDLLTAQGEDPSTKANNFFNEITQASDVDKYLSLKTVGTFTVDNSRNTMVASWDLSKWGELTSYWNYIKTGIKNDFQYATLNMNQSLDFNNVNHPNKAVLDNQGTNIHPLNLFTLLWNVIEKQVGDEPDYENYKENFVEIGQQLIPEQEVVNPWLLFSPDGEYYYLKEVNLPRGTWLRGHTYIYNLSFPYNSSPSFTVNVTPYVDGKFSL